MLMIEEERVNENSSELPTQANPDWSSSLQAFYETAQHLPFNEKVQLIRKLIETLDMSLPQRAEIAGSLNTTVFSLNLDNREKIAQLLELTASKFEQITRQEDEQNPPVK
jgi:hypothetical protein